MLLSSMYCPRGVLLEERAQVLFYAAGEPGPFCRRFQAQTDEATDRADNALIGERATWLTFQHLVGGIQQAIEQLPAVVKGGAHFYGIRREAATSEHRMHPLGSMHRIDDVGKHLVCCSTDLHTSF